MGEALPGAGDRGCEPVDHGAASPSRQTVNPVGPLSIHSATEPCSYRADFVCFDEIVVELKALAGLTPREHSQLINYLKATGLSRGLLINFGALRLETKRFVRSLPSA